jgi:hypothetical protein
MNAGSGSGGYRDEAHEMLSEIFNWFKEGFETVELKKANAILDELDQQQTVLANVGGRPPRAGSRHLRIQ